MTSTTANISSPVVIVGGGAAGLMAAITAASNGAKVVVFEKNPRPALKLRITGKGRCNLTNDCDRDEFLANVPTNPRFLYTALSQFSTSDTKAFFESLGIPLKTERGKRVFPVSDKASDIVDALLRECRRLEVSIITKKVIDISLSDGRITGVITSDGYFAASAVIICTGGLSYPRTGSDGDGYIFAKKASHTVTQLTPSLVPLTASGNLCKSLQGLSLKNISLKIVRADTDSTVYKDFGELMFTHFGLTGPLILSASAHIPDASSGKYEAHIDMKPALTEQMLDKRILSDFSKYINRDIINSLSDLLPQKMIAPFIEQTGISPHRKINSITQEERHTIVRTLKCIKVKITGFRPIDEAIITRGGVSVKEISPKSMESKLVEGLYFAGEVIDLDAYTGGFNLQIAFSTARLAAQDAAIRYLSAQ